MSLTWQTTLPTQPGWYAFRYPQFAGAPLTVIRHVVEDSGRLVQYTAGDESAWPLDTWQGVWCGPLDLDALAAPPPPCALCAALAVRAEETVWEHHLRIIGHHRGVEWCQCGYSAHIHQAPHPHGYTGSQCAGFVAREELP